MIRTSPADQLHERQTTLQWAIAAWEAQPPELQAVYKEAAQRIADALAGTTYAFSLQLPTHLWQSGDILSVSANVLTLRAGGALHFLRRQPCRAALIRALTVLAAHPNPTATCISKLTGYLVGKSLLDSLQIAPEANVFDASGKLMVSESTADEAINRLCQHMDRLKTIEQLFPGWTADENYSDTHSRLAGKLISQGRALAEYYTRQIIDDLAQRWQHGELIRGLTLFVPYLNERQYNMERHRVVVIPTGRIAFRPEFVVGACRVAQQEVRKNPQLSQATRWQLISQLDSIVQAFDHPKS